MGRGEAIEGSGRGRKDEKDEKAGGSATDGRAREDRARMDGG